MVLGQLLVSIVVNGQKIEFSKKLLSPDRSKDDWFGDVVTSSDKYLAISATRETDDANGGNSIGNAGAVYIYEKDGAEWKFVQKIVQFDRGSVYFGSDLDFYGDWLFVGVPFSHTDTFGLNPMSNAGSVYVFKRNSSGVWVEMQKLIAPERQSDGLYGRSVAVHGEYAVVGMPQYNQVDSNVNWVGTAYVFKLQSTGKWRFYQKLNFPSRLSASQFGYSVDIYDNTVLVGASWDKLDTNSNKSINAAGAAYFYSLNDSDDWVYRQKVVSEYRSQSCFFGRTVVLDKDRAIISSWKEDMRNTGGFPMGDAGSAYLYKRGPHGYWKRTQIITPDDRAAGDLFSMSVSLDSGIAVISAPYEDASLGSNYFQAGSVYIYEENNKGVYELYQKVISNRPAKNVLFGWAVTNQHKEVFIGASGETHNAENKDSIYYAGACFAYNPSISTDIANMHQQAKFSLYPNPFSGSFWISPNEPVNYEVRILDPMGRVIQHQIYSGSWPIQGRVEGPAGLYIIQINDGNGWVGTTLVKE